MTIRGIIRPIVNKYAGRAFDLILNASGVLGVIIALSPILAVTLFITIIDVISNWWEEKPLYGKYDSFVSMWIQDLPKMFEK
jgi:hypothetical protein